MSKKRRKILILGNGFDLAHFLPTKYEHFIHAMRVIEKAPLDNLISFDVLFEGLLQENDFILTKTKAMYKTEELILDKNTINILQGKLINNGWFQYFKDYLDSGIDTWIDFENEIENTLNVICNILSKNSDKNEIINSELYQNPINVINLEFFRIFNTNEQYYLNMLTKLSIFSYKYVKLNSGRDYVEISKNEYETSNRTGTRVIPTYNGVKRVIDQEQLLCIKSDFLRFYNSIATGVNNSRVIGHLNESLNEFIDIFSLYIEFIENLEPNVSMRLPKILQGELEVVYTFNYSSTIKNLYQTQYTEFLHGKAGNDTENRIVLGISELNNQILKDEKAYGFVKYYQKLLYSTDYQFLLGNPDLTTLEENKIKPSNLGFEEPIEIYIWGHSLDSSDSDYIEEIFSFNQGQYPSINLIVYYFGSPHAQLANLISIMGKKVIEKWMKKGWLEFVETPDIYRLNTEEGYEDKLSEYYEKQSKLLNLKD